MEKSSFEKTEKRCKEDVHCKRVAENAYRVLAENIQSIANVNDWAEMAGCSRSWLGRCIKNYFGKTANKMLIEKRYKKIRAVIEDQPAATASFVAGSVAPWNDKRLCNFLIYHFDTNFTKLRYKVLSKRNSRM